MAIDFVQPGDTPKSKTARSNGVGYGIDYTNPAAETSKTTSRFVGTQRTSSGASNISASTVNTTTPTSAMPMQAHVATRTSAERHLPPPPPPPQHLVATAPSLPQTKVVQPVAPVMAPNIVTAPPLSQINVQPQPQVQPQPVAQPKPVMPTPAAAPAPVVTPVAPTAPAPVAAPVVHVSVPTPMPTAPVMPAPTSAPHSQLTAVGEIVSQHVGSMRGETTNPDARVDSGLGVNLLPTASNQPATDQSALRRFIRTIALTLSALALMYLVMVGYATWFRLQTQTSFTELASIDKEITKFYPLQEKIDQTTATLTGVDQLFDEHMYWTNWFSFLEANTLSSVTYRNFSGSDNGVMTLEASAPDYATVTAQVAKLQTLKEVRNVTVTTATLLNAETELQTDTTVTFTLSLNVDPAILHYQSTYAKSE